jgi:hypothetical protein
MAFNRDSISQFRASFFDDLSRPSRFNVNIVVPPVLQASYLTSRFLSYRCEATQLPGRTLETIEQKTYGPVEKFPYLTSYQDIDLTFIVSGDMSERILFDSWIDYVNPKDSNNLRYKEEYATTISIQQYDVTGEMSYAINLIDAYPIAVNQLDLDWSNDGYHKLTVVFAYTYWEK